MSVMPKIVLYLEGVLAEALRDLDTAAVYDTAEEAYQEACRQVGQRLAQVAPEKAVYVVHFGNYFPREIDSIWATRALAERREEYLNEKSDHGMWDVEEWKVLGEGDEAESV